MSVPTIVTRFNSSGRPRVVACLCISTAIEHARVLMRRSGALCPHANRNTPAQTLILVAGAAKSPVAGDFFHQRLEFGVVTLDQKLIPSGSAGWLAGTGIT